MLIDNWTGRTLLMENLRQNTVDIRWISIALQWISDARICKKQWHLAFLLTSLQHQIFPNFWEGTCSSVKEYWSIARSRVLLCEKWLHEDLVSSEMCILCGCYRCLGNVKNYEIYEEVRTQLIVLLNTYKCTVL